MSITFFIFLQVFTFQTHCITSANDSVVNFWPKRSPPYFFTLPKKKTQISEKVIERRACVLIPSTIFIWNITDCMNNSVRYYSIINVHTSSCKVPVIDLRFLVKLEFYRQIFKKRNSISNFMETHPVGAEFFHGNRQTDEQTDGRTDRRRS